MMVFAQQVTVTGTVSDESGAVLPGVTILVQGTNVGAATDVNGRYTISGVSSQSVLVFSFIGFVTQEINVGDSRNINVTLIEDTQQIEEVIVVGYGTRRAGEMTGAVSVVKAEEIARIPAVTAGEVLRNVPGVTVLQANTPGAEPTIRVRGIGTINNSSPLWVVDGIPGGNVNPEDIETITVLKDAAAQAIYGTRAANGVILVTTKQGRRNERVRVTINARYGIQKNVNYYDMLNTQEYGEVLWLEQKNDHRLKGLPESTLVYSHPQYGNGLTPRIPDYIKPNGWMEGQVNAAGINEADPALYKHIWYDGTANQITRANKEGTDWMREISRNGKMSDINMNITGGATNTAYSFTLGYNDMQGALYYTGFKRYNARLNVNSNVNSWFSTGATLFATYSEQQGLMTQNAESSAISWCYRMQPIIPMYDIMGNFAGAIAGGELGNGQNPMNQLYLQKDNIRERSQINGTAFITLKPLEGLQYRSQISLIHNQYNNRSFTLPDDTWSERTATTRTSVSSNYTKRFAWTNTLQYDITLDKHELSFLAGTEFIDEYYQSVSANRVDYILLDPNYMHLTSGSGAQANDSGANENALFSIFGRINYSYAGKYLLEGVVRRDGSSRFAPDKRYGVFPAVSVGWVLTREAFMASTRTWLDNLKIRGGYGVTGNDRMNNYNSFSTFNFSTAGDQGSYYGISGANSGPSLGYRPGAIGNAQVQWEETATLNVGIDATFLRSLSVSFDLWQRRTTNMLYQQAIPMVLGRVTAPYLNVGEMSNKGFDLDIQYRGVALNKELRYTLGLNVSGYVNKIDQLTGNKDEFIDGPGLREQIYTRSKTGTAFPEYFGYTVDGILQSDAEAAAHTPAFGSYNAAGRYKFIDINGDGKVDSNDRGYIGSPHPKFVTGLNFNFEYKGFDLNGQLYASVGHKMINYVRRFTEFSQFNGGRHHNRLYKTWGSPYLNGDNSKATLPVAETLQSTTSQFPSTAWIEDASFLRLRNLQLGYNLTNVVNMPSVSSLRVYVQVTNLFTITNYSGLNPEQSPGNDFGAGDGPRNLGVDQGQWPTPRQWMFGVSIGL